VPSFLDNKYLDENAENGQFGAFEEGYLSNLDYRQFGMFKSEMRKRE